MKAAAYIVDYLVSRGVKHFFGYQGTMIAHFVDAIERDPRAENHVCYNEQGAAFAACGLAQRRDDVAVAYATSGPGAMNLMSGIANAYYDSLPVIFITGQINTYEYTDIPELRQQGFQEADIVSMAGGITKMAVQVRDAEELPVVLSCAWKLCREGRRGPVLIDLPMNIQRAEVSEGAIAAQRTIDERACGRPAVDASREVAAEEAAGAIFDALCAAERPVFLLGNGGHDTASRRSLLDICHRLRIPVVTSMISPLPAEDPCNLGYIGSAYGHRWANIIAGTKADLLVCFGISLCPRQVGFKPDSFAPGARVVRVDVDPASLKRRLHSDDSEVGFVARVEDVVPVLGERLAAAETAGKAPDFDGWLALCQGIKARLAACDAGADWRLPNRVVELLADTLLSGCDSVGIDVGQHMVWAGQSFGARPGQRLLFSGGHGAMGYGLPAAIGAHYATGGAVGCICGDGSFQMNIQELQWVARDRLPIRIVVMNNQSLGLIVQQQGDFFDGVYAGSIPEFGFSPCNFAEVACAYGIPSARIGAEELLADGAPEPADSGPFLLEVVFEEQTMAYPKTYFGETMFEQRPYVPRELLHEIAEM